MGNSFFLISILVVSYNQKQYIKECLDSVFSQGYENIEVCVADDGSTDGTQEILKTYRNKYPDKIKLHLSLGNQGITKNSNSALKLCTGKYIFILGGDDLMLPGKISKQVTLMEAYPDCSLCYHNLDVFQSETNETLYLYNDRFFPYQGEGKLVISKGTFMGACSVIVRQSDIPKGGFDERIPITSDWLFFIETALKGKVYYINEILGRYRRHGNNITLISSKNFDEQFLTLDIVERKYPQYKEAIFSGRKRLFFSKGIHFLKTKSSRNARICFGKAFPYSFFKTFSLYLLTCFQTLAPFLTDRIIYLLKKYVKRR